MDEWELDAMKTMIEEKDASKKRNREGSSPPQRSRKLSRRTTPLASEESKQARNNFLDPRHFNAHTGSYVESGFFKKMDPNPPCTEKPANSDKILEVLQEEIKEWGREGDAEAKAEEVGKKLLETIRSEKNRDMEGGGGTFVFAPTEDLLSIPYELSDKGAFEAVLKTMEVYNVLDENDRFPDVFDQFSEKAKDDIWQDNARLVRDHDVLKGMRKDGGFAVSASGCIRLAAAKFEVPSSKHNSNFRWPGMGTRHGSALAVCCGLTHGAVFVRSEKGDVYVLTKSSLSSDGIVWKLECDE
jgi:hypothetical protein